MDEFSLIKGWQQSYYRQSATIKGIGDDSAVISTNGNDMITAVDSFVENIHFTIEDMEAFYIGYRTLAASLSDIVVMGARPICYLVSIVIPDHVNEDFLVNIYKGFDALAMEQQIDLIGGDTTRGRELVLSITVIGKAEGPIRYRSAARPGDIVFVTGTLGDSRAGLEILLGNKSTNLPEHDAVLVKRHQMPELRRAFLAGLAESVSRLATNDISDGLANECHEIAGASKVSMIINPEKIPLSAAIQIFPKKDYDKWKLFGGEDFEIVCTVSPSNWEAVQKAASLTNTQITEIGYVTEKQTYPVYMNKDNTQIPLEKLGYIHQRR